MSDEDIKKAVIVWLKGAIVLARGEKLLIAADDLGWVFTITTEDGTKISSQHRQSADEAYDALMIAIGE